MKTRSIFMVIMVVTVSTCVNNVAGQPGDSNTGDYSSRAVLGEYDHSLPLFSSSRSLMTPRGFQNTGFLSIENESSLRELAISEGWSGSGTGDDPFIIGGYDLSYISITSIESHVVLRNNTAGVILLNHVSNLRIENKTVISERINGVLYSAIEIVYSSDVSINNNTMRASEFRVVDIYTSSKISICNNTIECQERAAIVATVSSRINITGNYLRQGIIGLGYEHSITVESCRDIQVSNNTLERGNVLIFSCVIVNIRDNIIELDLSVSSSRAVIIVNNIGDSIEVELTGQVTVENNTVSGFIGIKMSWTGTVSGNTANRIVIEDCKSLEEQDNTVINDTRTTSVASIGGPVIIITLIGLSLLKQNKKKDR